MKIILLVLALFSLELSAQCTTDPVLTDLTPGSGATTGGGSFQVVGTNFCAGVVVSFGTVAAKLTSVTATRIFGTVPAQGPGVVSFSITNPGRAPLIIQNAFTYVTTPAPLSATAGNAKFASVGRAAVFLGKATGGVPPYSYWWNFGDGASGGGVNGTRTYVAEGKYEVTLFVTDMTGAIAFSTTTAYITKPVTGPIMPAVCYLTDDKGNILTTDTGDRITCN